MDWKKLGERMEKSRLEREAEAARLAVDPGPPLEAKPVKGMRDWTRSIGVLYGTPTRVGDGWGIAIYPTRQQEALLEIEGQKHEDSGSHDQGYLKGMAAVSIDKNGRARAVTITEPRDAFVYDMGGNAYCRCATKPRTPERSTAIRPGSRAPEPARSPASASAGRNAEHERGAGIAR